MYFLALAKANLSSFAWNNRLKPCKSHNSGTGKIAILLHNEIFAIYIFIYACKPLRIFFFILLNTKCIDLFFLFFLIDINFPHINLKNDAHG